MGWYASVSLPPNALEAKASDRFVRCLHGHANPNGFKTLIFVRWQLLVGVRFKL